MTDTRREWDPRTRVSLPKPPEHVVARLDIFDGPDWVPFATAEDSRGARAFFLRDEGGKWHRVSEADHSTVADWYEHGAELEITEEEPGWRDLAVRRRNEPFLQRLLISQLPFEEAAA